MPGSSGSARVARAAVRFAGVDSAPTVRVKVNKAKQNNSKRKANIAGNVGKMNAYLAEAASYPRHGCLPCTRATNPQRILFAQESKAHSAFPQFLEFRDERGGTVGKVTGIPPKLLSVGAEHHDRRKSHDLVFLCKLAILLP